MALNTRKRLPSSRTITSSSSQRRRPETTYNSTDDIFKTSKQDKRIIKHSAFISRIEKNSTKSKKRRRPSKKLVANLESLMDALPETDKRYEEGNSTDRGIIKHNSLKSMPGALKRKDKLEKMERDRFSRNMAQMAGNDFEKSVDDAERQETESNSSSRRWAALRGFIQRTMDQNPAVSSG